MKATLTEATSGGCGAKVAMTLTKPSERYEMTSSVPFPGSVPVAGTRMVWPVSL